jgi:hypothetical protein
MMYIQIVQSIFYLTSFVYNIKGATSTLDIFGRMLYLAESVKYVPKLIKNTILYHKKLAHRKAQKCVFLPFSIKMMIFEIRF